MKVMEDFGIARETTIHTVLNKTHNGISACYYLLKQAMKDSGDLVTEEVIKEAKRVVIAAPTTTKTTTATSTTTSTSTTSTTKKSIRPLSAPAARGKPKSNIVLKNPNRNGDKTNYYDDDESFIKEDDGDDDSLKKVGGGDSLALGHLGGISVGGSKVGGGAGTDIEGGGERNKNLILKQ